MKSFTLSVLIILFFWNLVIPETIKVPADQPTIQDAINAASDSDTVLVDPGTWVQGISFDGKSIVVGSLYLNTGDSSYISGTVIDGNQTSSTVLFTGGEDSTTVLCGFTIQNGSAVEGGGIRCENAQPTLKNLIVRNNSVSMDGGGLALFGSSVIVEDVTFEGNSAEVGGGVYCTDSDLSMINVVVSGNTSVREGAGFQIHYSNIQLDSCTIMNNSAQDGNGGGFQYLNDEESEGSFEINLTNTVITGNSSTWSGGGMMVRGTSGPYATQIELFVDRCEFSDNVSDNYSGLRISSESINFSISNCSFIGNEAYRYAAGAGFSSSCMGEVSNSLFLYNSASTEEEGWNSGGVSVWSGAQVDFMNCTFVENGASYGAGLTAGGGGIATTTNCIFWENGDDQIALDSWDNQGGTLTVNYCDIQGGEEYINLTDELSTLHWEDGNIDLDPSFEDWENANFHLSDYSLCIGVGTSEGAPETDMDGNPRPDPAGSDPDMGAYENSRAAPLHSSIYVPPDAIELVLDTAEIDSHMITVSNSGTSELTYFVNTDIVTVVDSSNYGLAFDGSVKTVEVANPDSFDFTKDFSITAWIKTTDAGVIISKSNAQDVPGPKCLFVEKQSAHDTGNLAFDVGFMGGLTGERPIADTIWHHVAVTAENNGTALIKLYVDGELDSEDYIDISSNPEDGFGLRMGFDGREPDEFPNFNGLLDEISVWNRAISANEIKNLMHKGLTGAESGLIGYWPMDEGTGTICEDHSTNENDGTLLNNPGWEVSNVPVNPWLICKPVSGTVPQSDQTTITAVYDLTGVEDGVYEADIVFTSNDPYNPREVRSLRIDRVVGLEDISSKNVPVRFELSQNYPNPFNPVTVIGYQLSAVSEVNLSVYNLIGQKVAVLVNEKQSAGHYQFEWDASEFASGVYFYRLTTDRGFTDTKKLIIIK